MIFVCVGSRDYQFNRLFVQLDKLVEMGDIDGEILAQIGQSSYIPKYFKYKRFMSVDEFKDCQKKADLIISHGGTGALIGALKLKKQVLAVPRLEKYGEHTDDHQIQVSKVLDSEGYLKCVLNMDDLLEGIKILENNPIKKVYNKSTQVIDIINNFIKLCD